MKTHHNGTHIVAAATRLGSTDVPAYGPGTSNRRGAVDQHDEPTPPAPRPVPPPPEDDDVLDDPAVDDPLIYDEPLPDEADDRPSRKRKTAKGRRQ